MWADWSTDLWVESIGDLLGDNPQLAEIFEQLGGAAGIVDAYFATVMGILALVTTAFAIRTVLRLRAEEESLRADVVLATAVKREQWVRSHLLFAVVGPLVMLAAAGTVAGLTHGALVGDVAGQAPTVIGEALIQIPAVWVVLGVAVALFGLVPRLTPVSWGVIVASLLLGQLGQILQFPQWALNLSPFSHIPRLTSGDFDSSALVVLTAIALILTAVGVGGFRRRDVMALSHPTRERRVRGTAAYCAGMRPATAIAILILLVLILVAGAFQLRAILIG